MDDAVVTQASVCIRFAFRSGALRAFDFVAASGSVAETAAAALNAAGGAGRPFHALPAMTSSDECAPAAAAAAAAAAPLQVVRVVTVAPTSPEAMQQLIASLNAAVRALDGGVKQRPGASWRPCPPLETSAALQQAVEECITAAWPSPVWRSVRVLSPDTSPASADAGGGATRMAAVSVDSVRVDGADGGESYPRLALSMSVSMLRHRQLRIPDDAVHHLLTTGVSAVFREPRPCVVLPSACPALLVALHPGWADDVACNDEYSQPGDTADAANIVAEVRLDTAATMLVPLAFVSGPGGGASPAGIHVATSVALSLAALVHGACLFGVQAPCADDVTLPDIQRRRCDAAKEDAEADAEGSAWTWEEEAPFAPAGRGQAPLPTSGLFVSALFAPVGTGVPDHSDASDGPAQSLEPEAEAAEPPPPEQQQRLQRPQAMFDYPVEAVHEDEAPPTVPRRPLPPAAGPATAPAVPLARKPMFAAFKQRAASTSILPRAVANADKKGGPAGKPAGKPRAEPPAATKGDVAEPAAKKPRPAKEELDPVAVDADVRHRAATGGASALAKLTLPQCKAFLKHNKVPGGLGGNKQVLLDRIAGHLGLQAPVPASAVPGDPPLADAA